MSEAATNNGDDEILTVNFKVTRSFLDEIEDTWQGRGFNSRSEFIGGRGGYPEVVRKPEVSVITRISDS
ncbi:ribbon-helix-helix domain-containing protein, partial [Natrialbaceae archaeon A-CW1-1]